MRSAHRTRQTSRLQRFESCVVNLTRNLAVMYGPQRINVNSVCPGLIPTAMTRPTSPELEQWHSDALQGTPWPRLGTSQDVAHWCCFSLLQRQNGSQELPCQLTEVRAPNETKSGALPTTEGRGRRRRRRNGSAWPLAGGAHAGDGCAGDDLHANAARLGAALGLHGDIAAAAGRL
jgi:hypothetical protein